MSDNQSKQSGAAEIIIGGKPVPVGIVAVCPVTGQPLVRKAEHAGDRGLMAYTAKEVPASQPLGDIPERPHTFVHPELVDTSKLR